MHTPLRLHMCAFLCECECDSSEPAKCRECTQLVKESGPTHLSTCADNGPRLRAYIYTLINQLRPLISQSGNLMSSHSIAGYTGVGGGPDVRMCKHSACSNTDTVHILQALQAFICPLTFYVFVSHLH